MTERTLTLERPLALFDLETTGTDVSKDRIVEIAALVIHPDGHETSHRSLVNPEIPIPPEATEIHKISDADVAAAPTFAKLAPSLWKVFSGCDIGGYNAGGFDVPMLEMHFERAGLKSPLEGACIVDAKDIFHQREPRDLAAAMRFYCGEELVGAHGAAADIAATAKVLRAQLQRYTDIPLTPKDLYQMFAKEKFVDPTRKLLDDKGVIKMGFGQHKGTSLADLAKSKPDYLQWILRGEFHSKVKEAVKHALLTGK